MSPRALRPCDANHMNLFRGMGISAIFQINRSRLQAIPDSQGRLALNQPLSECVADCELAAAIEARSQLHHISHKRQLFRQGQLPDRLFLLHTGEVVLTSRLPDRSVLGFRAIPGSLIGLPAIAGNQSYSMTATVRKCAELYSISLGTFGEIVGKNPRLAFRVLEILEAEVKSARVQVANALTTVRPAFVAPEATKSTQLESVFCQ
jgi:CRP-like cAMP-binding protein